jgi:hypothetical protein
LIICEIMNDSLPGTLPASGHLPAAPAFRRSPEHGHPEKFLTYLRRGFSSYIFRTRHARLPECASCTRFGLFSYTFRIASICVSTPYPALRMREFPHHQAHSKFVLISAQASSAFV